jgi:hypothetical protein
MYDTVIFESSKTTDGLEQKLWPRHCVQWTEGANFFFDSERFHPFIKVESLYNNSM